MTKLSRINTAET